MFLVNSTSHYLLPGRGKVGGFLGATWLSGVSWGTKKE